MRERAQQQQMALPDPNLAHLLAGEHQHLAQAGFREAQEETDHEHEKKTMIVYHP